MKKNAAIWLLTVLFLVCLAACGAEQQPSQEEQPARQVEETVVPEAPGEEAPAEVPVEEAPAEVVLSDVRAAIVQRLAVADPLMVETDALLNLYGITAETVKQSASFVTMSGTFPDEVVLVEAVDEAAADAIQASLETRLGEVLVQSEAYDPENYAAAQACQVLRTGLHLALILSPEHADMVSVYQEFVK